MYLDCQAVTTLVAGGAACFSRAELEQADDYLAANEGFISNINRNGFAVGVTQNEDGARHLSVYANGFWLGMLFESGDGKWKPHGVTLPITILRSLGTKFEEEGRALAGLISANLTQNDDVFCGRLNDPIVALKEKMTAGGMLDSRKQSLHVTKATLDILTAGGSMNGRLNAVLARYAAICADPSKAHEFSALEALERQFSSHQAG